MTRGARQYNKLREILVDAMGGKCAEPGCKYRGDKLHIDHPAGRDWEPRELSSHMRIKRYISEYNQGLVRLLCVKHNNQTSNRPSARRMQDGVQGS